MQIVYICILFQVFLVPGFPIDKYYYSRSQYNCELIDIFTYIQTWYFSDKSRIYIYIVIHRQICFVLSELISVASGIETRLTQTPIQDSTPQPRGTSSRKVNFKRLWTTITIVNIHPLNGYRELNSYMKSLAINANGNAITSFARELNPTGEGEYIYIYIYIVIHRQICFVLSELISAARHTSFP